MKCKIFIIFIATLLICGLFFEAEAGKKKLLKKGLKAALIAKALKPTKAIIPIPLPIPFHIPIHVQSWPAPR